MPWLTNDTPLPNLVQGVVFLPDSEYLQACFWGAFLALANPASWEKSGTAEPEDIAELFGQAYEQSRT